MLSSPTLIKEFLGQLMAELNDARSVYAEVLSVQKLSKQPAAYDELLTNTALWGAKIKQEIREVTNGSFKFSN